MFSKSIAAKRPFKLTLLASIAMCGAFAAAPAFSASTTATATAEVITPISITKATDLVFGSFAAGAGGTITVNTAGVRAAVGAVGLSGATPAAASFDIAGQAGMGYAITVTSDAKLTSGANTMDLAVFSDLTAAGATSGSVATGLLNAGGTQKLYVGGTLTVSGTQAGGSYSGSINAEVAYN